MPALPKLQFEMLGVTAADGVSDGARVLIADDSAVSRRLLEAVLRNWGYQVTTVSNGSQAWEALQRPDAPRLAILDWMMPGLSGPEVCSLVRNRQKEPNALYTYIILLTSRGGGPENTPDAAAPWTSAVKLAVERAVLRVGRRTDGWHEPRRDAHQEHHQDREGGDAQVRVEIE